jgi:1-acyl-sn-glycerol-3-phosphate acyltransferase
MIRSCLILTAFWIFMLFSLLFFIPYLPLLLPGLSSLREAYVLTLTRFWARFIIFLTGGKLELRGQENLPEERNLCFVANHQSYVDIPVVMASLPRVIGFIAKKELKHVPILSSWMKTMGCLFLDRKNPRQAITVFNQAVEELRRGKAKLIFPEGTRSKGDRMGEIHAGALKLPFRSEAIIVPLTIDGTYHLFEESKRVSNGKVVLTIHPPVHAAGLSKEEQKNTAKLLESIIAGPLPK